MAEVTSGKINISWEGDGAPAVGSSADVSPL